MIRKHENSDSWKAGALAIGVHAVLLVGMLVSFNWKAAHPVQTVTEVELWDKLPAPKTLDTPKPEPKPIIEEKPEPKPEPKPIVEEKPKPQEPKVDIELEKKKKEVEQKETEKLKKLEEKRKKDDETKQLAQKMRDEDLLDKKVAEKKAKADKDALRKINEDILNETGADDAKAASAANAGIIKEFTDKMANKIRGKITSGVCGEGNPVLKVNIDILPTGQIRGSARITKSSGNPACDDAVERAILASEPFQLPEDSKLKAEFRDMILTFKPND